jgi:hypothetical protein
VVWDNCSRELTDLIESVQYRAAKIVSGAIHRTSHTIVYKELEWDSLKERRKKQRLKLYHKAVIEEAPVYLQNTLPQKVGMNLRNADDYVTASTRTDAFKFSFFPKTTSDWNELDEDTKSAKTSAAFKNKLDKDKIKVPKWYYTGDRPLNIYHARLRMLCSSLNDHLYSHIHVIESPECACGNIRENNKHFFLECPMYVNERQVMLQKLNATKYGTSLNKILYGDETCSSETNVAGFKIIQEYLKATERF